MIRILAISLFFLMGVLTPVAAPRPAGAVITPLNAPPWGRKAYTFKYCATNAELLTVRKTVMTYCGRYMRWSTWITKPGQIPIPRQPIYSNFGT